MNMTHKKNYDWIWKQVRNQREFSLSSLLSMGDNKSCRAFVYNYIRRLEKGGFLSGKMVKNKKVYRLIKDNGRYPPRIQNDGQVAPPEPRQRMWMGIKAIGRFTIKDVALIAEISPARANRYMRLLFNAGYITSGQNVPFRKDGQFIFRKNMDTGPNAPQPLKDGGIYDANTQKTLYASKADK